MNESDMKLSLNDAISYHRPAAAYFTRMAYETYSKKLKDIEVAKLDYIKEEAQFRLDNGFKINGIHKISARSIQHPAFYMWLYGRLNENIGQVNCFIAEILNDRIIIDSLRNDISVDLYGDSNIVVTEYSNIYEELEGQIDKLYCRRFGLADIDDLEDMAKGDIWSRHKDMSLEALEDYFRVMYEYIIELED